MAYQKLNTSRAWRVVPSDQAPIPNIPRTNPEDIAGTATAVSTTQVTDSSGDFITRGVKNGMILTNRATGDSAIITGVQQDVLTIKGTNPINAVGDTYAVYYGDNNGAVLYVGTGGILRVLTAGGDDVRFIGVAAGSFIPVNVVQVFATSTTADDIIALW